MFRHQDAIIMELYRLVVYHTVGHDTLHTLYHEISSDHVRSRQTSVCMRHTVQTAGNFYLVWLTLNITTM